MDMDHYDSRLLPRLIELKNEIQTNPSELTLDTTHQTNECFHSIMLELNEVYNSSLPINKTIPDVLYRIFSLAVHDSNHPGHTALVISHVCRHWRESILGWPTLWTFIDLNYSDPLIDLLLARSEDTSLALSWTQPTSANSESSSKFFQSRAVSTLPRLCSLTLHLSEFRLLTIGDVIRSFQPLQLRHLDIETQAQYPSFRMPPLTDIFQVDPSSLERLKLHGMNFPWLVFPGSKLMHFSFLYPNKPPLLCQFLAVLSCCPLLCELEFRIRKGYIDRKPSGPGIPSVSEVNLPKLKKLILGLENSGMSGFDYLQQFSACIKTGVLFEFKLFYNNLHTERRNESPSSLNIFGPVPAGTFSHFKDHHYLFIDFKIDNPEPVFYIMSAPKSILFDDGPLCILGSCPEGVTFDHSPILDLIRALPEITHLALCGYTWKGLDSLNINLRQAFPCLDTLELWEPDDPNLSWAKELNSLCVRLEAKTLILADVYSLDPEALLNITSRTSIKVLKLRARYYDEKVSQTVVTALRRSGVAVVRCDTF